MVPEITDPREADRRHVGLVGAAEAAHRDVLTALEGALECSPRGGREAVPLPLLLLPVEEAESLPGEDPAKDDEAERRDEAKQDLGEPAAEVHAVLLDEEHRQRRAEEDAGGASHGCEEADDDGEEPVVLAGGPERGNGEQEEERLGIDRAEEERGREDGDGGDGDLRDAHIEVHLDELVRHDERAEERYPGDEIADGLDGQAGDAAAEVHEPRVEREEGREGGVVGAVALLGDHRVPGAVPVAEGLDDPVLPGFQIGADDLEGAGELAVLGLDAARAIAIDGADGAEAEGEGGDELGDENVNDPDDGRESEGVGERRL